MPTFKHSGALGDVIYALPTIRGLGGGELFLSLEEPSYFWRGLYGDPLPILRRLLERQSYITAVRPYEGQRIDYNLDDFRKFFGTHCASDSVTISDMHLMTFGLPPGEGDRAWLSADPRPLPDGKSVVLCRGGRYHSTFFRWQRIVEVYGERAVFCGMPEEHAELQAQVGEVSYLPTKDLLELAQYISGCELFIGNQSSPYAIAEGLKVRTLQEVCPDCPNCVFTRPGALYRTVY